MADTADLRSEGRTSKDPVTAAARRLLRKNREAAGLCVMCGITQVLNRKTCYACSTEQSVKTSLSGLRYFCRDCSIDPEASLIILDSILEGQFHHSPKAVEEVLKLKALMKQALHTSQGKPRKKK